MYYELCSVHPEHPEHHEHPPLVILTFNPMFDPIIQSVISDIQDQIICIMISAAEILLNFMCVVLSVNYKLTHE